MVKGLPHITRWEHALYPGGTFDTASEDIAKATLRIGGRRVILAHMGTNLIDIRGWKGRLSCEQRLMELMAQVKRFYSLIRSFNATCFIIFSSVLPRPVDFDHSDQLRINFNKALKAFARRKACGFLPTYTSFLIRSAGPAQGRPLPGVWARRDGGLHLNMGGRFLLNERLKSALAPKELGRMARNANFSHWR